jgi:hypothetical protein
MKVRNVFTRLARLERAMPPPVEEELVPDRYWQAMATIYGKGTPEERQAWVERKVAKRITKADLIARFNRHRDKMENFEVKE